MNVRDKKVIVTGGARGLGRAMLELLVSEGAIVSVFDLDTTSLNDASADTRVDCIQCDLSDYDQVIEATQRYHDRFGAADVLVNNAGILYSAPLIKFSAVGLERHPLDMWRKVMAADLDSVFFMTLSIVERMIQTRTKGVIVNISSVSAGGNVGQSAYSAAKAAVNALTTVWAKELSPLGIRVVGVAPGFTETESTKAAISESVLKDTINKVPLRRLGKPEEIAAAVLAVITNDFFNGKVFQVDGGLVL